MSPAEQAHWRRVREIFDEASEAESSERAGMVALCCSDDVALRRDVEQLLALQKEAGLALDRPPLASLQQQERAAEAARAAADSQPAPRYQEGALIGDRYRIVKFLARGGMGEVYAAFDQTESRAVALKFVRSLPDNQHQLEARFLREVRMARKIEHPNVCRIFDLAEHGGERFCAMELLHGETLASALARDGKLAPAAALRIALQLCDGLAAAHRAGVLHRDLKPGNVFLVDGRAVIIDFGLAAAAVRDLKETDSSLTATGAVIGTLAYMAPEHFEERGGGAPADLYSLGVILYEMLTGEKPHDAKSPFRLAAQKARESHRTPSGSGIAGMPAVWREVITRSLKARPEDRYPSAGAMKQALERGRPSLRFFLTQPRVLIPALALIAGLLGWAGWQAARKDHVTPAQAAGLYEEAYQAMTTASPARAVKLLERAVELDPKFVTAWSLLAVAHAETDQIDKAKDVMLEAIAAKDKRWVLGRGEALALAAANAAVVRDYQGAAQHYGKLAALAGHRDFARLSQARMLSSSGKFNDAVQVLEAAIATAPDAKSVPAGRIRLATLLARKREDKRAEAEFEKAEAAYRMIGNLEGLCDVWIARARDRADLDRAIEHSAKAGNRQQNLEAKLRLVVVLEREVDYEGAIALAKEVAADAQREGRLLLAARATADLGYAYVYLRKYPEALPHLRQSVELAARAKSYGALAANRWRLGEVLNSLRQFDEALTVMEPAVQWYRQGGGDYTLPMVLVKWGTVLHATHRFEEAEPVFREAHDLAERDGLELYQAMALQRWSSFHYARDLRKASEIGERMLVHARKTRLTAAYFQAANLASEMGRFDLAEELLAEGEKEAIEKQAGADQRRLLETGRGVRAEIQLRRGRCAEAFAATPKSGDDNAEARLRRMRACAGTGSIAIRREDLAWVEAKIAELSKETYAVASLSITAGDLALHLSDWSSARAHALRGIPASRALRLRVVELQNALVLRAAEANLGNRAEAERLTPEVLTLSRAVGFEPPSGFGGRQDLLYCWKLGNNKAKFEVTPASVLVKTSVAKSTASKIVNR